MGAVENLVFHDTYRIERKLGSGGMGEVYVATHLRLKREVAIKLLDKKHADNSDAWGRFRREAEIASQLGHPNIIQVIDFNHTSDGEPYIVMELLEGEDLASRLARGTLPTTVALRLFEQIASALAAVHDRGVVHRDLKPRNVFLCYHGDDDPFPKVLDFGVSKIMGSTSVVTADRAVLGTPNYMAPEQAEGNAGQVDARADQFALATMLYEMLSGNNPFASDSMLGSLYKVVNDTPPPLDEVVDGLPPAVSPAVARAMAKRADDRFEDVRAFARTALDKPASSEALLSPSETSADAPTVPAASADAFASTFTSGAGEISLVTSVPRSDRQRGLWLIAAVVAAALMIGGGLLLRGGGSSGDASAPAPATKPNATSTSAPAQPHPAPATTSVDAGADDATAPPTTAPADAAPVAATKPRVRRPRTHKPAPRRARRAPSPDAAPATKPPTPADKKPGDFITDFK